MNEEFFDDLNQDTYETISVISEDGKTIECFVIDALNLDNSQYILVVPCDDFEKNDTEAFILKQVNDNGEEVTYSPIQDDNEYNKILILFQENDGEYEMSF